MQLRLALADLQKEETEEIPHVSVSRQQAAQVEVVILMVVLVVLVVLVVAVAAPTSKPEVMEEATVQMVIQQLAVAAAEQVKGQQHVSSGKQQVNYIQAAAQEAEAAFMEKMVQQVMAEVPKLVLMH